jgi:hypothetical protein
MGTVTVEHLARLLDLPADASLRSLYREALDPRAKLVEPLLSLAASQGYDIGVLGQAHLAAAKLRQDRYGQLLSELRQCAAVLPLKGLDIAARYPVPLVRGCVDLDLYVPSAGEVWQVVRWVLRHCPVRATDVSLLGEHVFVGMSWPSPVSALDAVYRVEVSTAPFVGDLRTVPVRAGTPADTLARNLLLLAEEQFQRGIGARDVLDCHLLLAGADRAATERVGAAATEFRLLPELTALLARTQAARLGGADFLARWIEDLAPTTAAERAERRRAPAQQAGLEYGLLLDPEATAEQSMIVELGPDRGLLCPTGGYLLVRDHEVDEDRYDRARANLAALTGQPATHLR